MIKIVPSLSPQKELTKVQERLVQAKDIDRVHVDFVDGIFAANTTVEPQELSSVTTHSKLDFHLMVDKPVTWLHRCVEGKAGCVIAQIERMIDVEAFIDVARDMIGSVGVAIDLDTPVAELIDHSLDKVDIVQVMSVRAGFGGQEFDSKALKKISLLKKLRSEHGYAYKIVVDGGITPENIKSIVEAGADEVCVGRRLFDGDLADNIQKYQKAAVGK